MIVLMIAALFVLLSALCLFAGSKTLFRKTPAENTPPFTAPPCFKDHSDASFFVTGDKHRHFDSIRTFCRKAKTRRKDVLIVLGDAGFNYYGDIRDEKLKAKVSRLPITLFCLHGNKENRPQNIGTYGLRSFCGGLVYYEPRFPHLLFAKDGEIYTFKGKKYLAVGGAHSVDKMRCLANGSPFFEDEMPDAQTKRTVEAKLRKNGGKIFGMLTHTCPIDFLPREMFLSTKMTATAPQKPKRRKAAPVFKPDIDRSTEIWLGELEKHLRYRVWLCGHYHTDKSVGKLRMFYRDICALPD